MIGSRNPTAALAARPTQNKSIERWADEWNLCREPLTPGVKILDSRRLTTSHQANPWFAVDGGNAGEEQGEVWFGALAWSSNWAWISTCPTIRAPCCASAR